MFKKAWPIALQVLKELSKDRLALLWLILLPMLWISLWGFLLGGGDEKIPLGLVDLDQSLVSRAFIDDLSTEKGLLINIFSDPESAQRSVEDLISSLALVIPQGFAEKMVRGEIVKVEAYQSGRSSSYFLIQAVDKSLKRVASSAQAAGFAIEQITSLRPVELEEQVSLWENLFSRAEEEWQNPQITLQFEVLGAQTKEHLIPEGMNQSSPGFTIMFVLFGLMLGAGSLVEERRNGTLARILTTPTSRGSLFFGKFLGYLSVALLQFAILILFGQFMLGVNYSEASVGVALVGISFSLAAVGISMLLASLVRSHRQAEAFSILLANLLGMLGGSWWPLEIVPPALQTVGKFTPVYWGVNGLNRLITNEQGVAAILPNVYILLGFAALSLVLSVLLFHYE